MTRLKKDYDDAKAREKARQDFIPKVKSLIEVYWTVEDAPTRNKMLKEVLQKVDYLKETRNKKGQGKQQIFFCICIRVFQKTCKSNPKLKKFKQGILQSQFAYAIMPIGKKTR